MGCTLLPNPEDGPDCPLHQRFPQLNKRIVRKPYPIPWIQDMLLNLEGFQYATSLDLNMGYYHIELSPNSKKLCTLVTPFGKYEMQKLPMGLCNSPDIFQEKVSILMEGLEFVCAYIDDLLVLSKGNTQATSWLHWPCQLLPRHVDPAIPCSRSPIRTMFEECYLEVD
jgi:hypothetical protein